jgi:multicomponent Na+:H+ antiporter subunit E
MRYLASLVIVLGIVWLGLSGHFEPLLLGLGLVSCLAVIALGRRMRLIDAEGAPIQLSLRGLLYTPWLLWEILKANVDVARRILSPRLPIDPRVIRVKASQRSDVGRVVYANSITLTPGTVSLRIEDDEIEVHALTAEAAAGLQDGRMDRRVSWLEHQR